MRKATLYILSLFLFLNFNSKNILAQEVKATFDEEANILIADTFSIHLEAKVPPNAHVIWPEIGLNIGDLEINHEATSDVDSIKNESEWILHQQLVLASFDTGYFPIPPFEFIINEDTFPTQPQLVKISGVAIDTTDLTVKPIKDTLGAPITFMDIFWPYGVIAIAAILLIIGLVTFLVSRQKPGYLVEAPKIVVPPHVWALQELEKLKSESLWQNGSIKDYYIRISEIFRQYIELRFEQPALESTTVEIVNRLKLLGIDQSLIEKSNATLQLADYVKFAKAKPTENEHIQSFQTVLDFVNTTKIEEPKADINQ